MTTATPAARRPRPLQVFTVERRAALLARALTPLVYDETVHHNQATIYVVAPTKAAAIERLIELGMRFGAGVVRVAMGDDVDIARAAGLLAADGDVVFFHESNNGKSVAQVRTGQTATVVGHWSYTYNGFRGLVLADGTEIAEAQR